MRCKEPADCHNRRRNIETVSRRCKENNYPYLAWPEDKELLTLADLPVLSSARRPNTPPTWMSMIAVGFFPALTDAILRQRIRAGFAYYVIAITNVGPVVQEYAVKSI